jgi:hypothetical protein
MFRSFSAAQLFPFSATGDMGAGVFISPFQKRLSREQQPGSTCYLLFSILYEGRSGDPTVLQPIIIQSTTSELPTRMFLNQVILMGFSSVVQGDLFTLTSRLLFKDKNEDWASKPGPGASFQSGSSSSVSSTSSLCYSEPHCLLSSLPGP